MTFKIWEEDRTNYTDKLCVVRDVGEPPEYVVKEDNRVSEKE